MANPHNSQAGAFDRVDYTALGIAAISTLVLIARPFTNTSKDVFGLSICSPHMSHLNLSDPCVVCCDVAAALLTISLAFVALRSPLTKASQGPKTSES
jgi:hypothetical protein